LSHVKAPVRLSIFIRGLDRGLGLSLHALVRERFCRGLIGVRSSVAHCASSCVGHIRSGQLVAVTGPELNVVTVENDQRTLTEVIAQFLCEEYGLEIPPERMTMGEAVAVYLRKHGRDALSRLYREINDVILKFERQPCEPLRLMAAGITNINCSLVRHPTSALNDVRFGGRPNVNEIAFSPTQATEDRVQCLRASEAGQTSIVRLFGGATSTPQYAIYDEDILGWLHSLLSGNDCLPEKIMSAFKKGPLLFIGCDVPDWLDIFLLRLSSQTRLSQADKQFFFVHSSPTDDPLLQEFFSTYGGSSILGGHRRFPR
jgi:hypothetical protein